MTRYDDYVANRTAEEPRMQAEINAAAAELALGEAIEAGDGLSVHEVLWLLHALGLSISIDPSFRISAAAPALLRRSAG